MKNCTRFFTQEQIDEIRMRLAAISGAKDSQFEKASYVGDTDYIAIVQQGKNKRADIQQLRTKVFEMDETPTPGSNNGVTSNGIYNYIQEVIEQIIPEEVGYLYISSDSEMFDYLVNGTGGTHNTPTYNQYCEQLYDAIQEGKFIIIDDAICVTSYKTDPKSFTLQCISSSKYIYIGAHDENALWAKIPGTTVNTDRYLIDNKYLKDNKYINQVTLNQILQDTLQDYITYKALNKSTDNYPKSGSSNFVTSNGVYQYVQDSLADFDTKSYLQIMSNSEMFDYIINGQKASYDKTVLNQYCEQLYDALNKGDLVLIDNFICQTLLTPTPNNGVRIKLTCISDTKYVQTLLLGGYNHQGEREWAVLDVGDNVIVDETRYLVSTEDLVNTLDNYVTTAQQTILLNQIRSNINAFRTEYDARMEVTPKYHKLNWVTDEKDSSTVDAQGGYEITDNSSAVTAANRYSSLWWAIKDSNEGNTVSKAILYKGASVCYAQADDLSLLSRSTILTVRVFDGITVTQYTIEKRTRNNEVYLYVLPTILN